MLQDFILLSEETMIFNKRNQEPEAPKLQGEDFDIFPKMDGYRYAKEANAADNSEEPQEAAPPELTDLQKKIARPAGQAVETLTTFLRSLLGFLCSFSNRFLGRTKTFGDMA
jgi:hypothetical protein